MPRRVATSRVLIPSTLRNRTTSRERGVQPSADASQFFPAIEMALWREPIRVGHDFFNLGDQFN